MTIIPHPRHYWQITNNDGTLFTGTFDQCWQELVGRYSTLTLGQLQSHGVRISRKGTDQ